MEYQLTPPVPVDAAHLGADLQKIVARLFCSCATITDGDSSWLVNLAEPTTYPQGFTVRVALREDGDIETSGMDPVEQWMQSQIVHALGIEYAVSHYRVEEERDDSFVIEKDPLPTLADYICESTARLNKPSLPWYTQDMFNDYKDLVPSQLVGNINVAWDRQILRWKNKHS